MMKNNIRVQAQNKPYQTGVELLISDGRSVGSLAFTEVEDHLICESTAVISNTAAQELMDALWHCGIRPSEGAGSAGSLKATEKHLSDMRKIAFKYIDNKDDGIFDVTRAE